MSAPLLPLRHSPDSAVSFSEVFIKNTVPETVYGSLTVEDHPETKPFLQGWLEKYLETLARFPLRTRMWTVGLATATSSVFAALMRDLNPFHLRMRLVLTLFAIAMFINAPSYYILYEHLERWFPTMHKWNIVIHLMIDQLIAAPVYVFLCLLVKALLMGTFKVSSFMSTTTDQLLHILKFMWMVYPITQCINFAFVPPKFRVLFCTLVSFFVNMLVAYVFTSPA